MVVSRAGASVGRRAALGLLGLVLATGSLVGCQSNPEPPPIEAASSAPSPSPSPTEAPPTLPAEANGTSEAAAKAFVRHFFDTVNHAVNTGQTEHLRQLGSTECESCEAIAGNIEETYGAGGSIQSKGWKLQSVSLVPGQPKASPILDLGVLMSGERVIEQAGAEPKTFDGGKQPMTMYLVRVAGAWRVSRLDRVA